MASKLVENPYEGLHQHEEDGRCVHELLQSIDMGLYLVVRRLEALLGDEKAKQEVTDDLKDRNADQ